ncbi:hypothetical protein [Flavobacterium sp. WC2509]|uniref:hypothetical protein n=1 Tax=Flavobacterium sp. WC2509 TaxID=3461406 RepID=UPI0040444D75
MSVFDELIAASNSVENLSFFIEQNNDRLYDFFLTQNFNDLNVDKNRIELYISNNLQKFKKLDFSIELNKSFISILLDVSQRFSFLMPFHQLYKLLIKNNLNISSRLEASSLYLIGIKKISDYDKIIDSFLDKLSIAYNQEEDTEDKVIDTFISYYALVINDFGKQNNEGVVSIKNKILSKNNNPNYYFLQNNLINQVLNLDVIDPITSYNKIQILLDTFLKRVKRQIPFENKLFLIEEGTNYVELLESATANFHSIRQISVDQFALINDSNVFYSLQRGVKIIEKENQLFSYLKSYGKMHHTKLVSSFKHLPRHIFNENPHCIDWGCGQGMASMTLLEYLNDYDIDQSISQMTLIEPSLIALKRASLHVSKFSNNTKIINTINKDLDSLVANDFLQVNKTRIHLFSNILDMDVFSLSKLIELIKANFSGENYFLCVSPYITDLKTARIDSFVNAFSGNEGFEELFKINSKSDDWINGWTRVVRVFKCVI